MPNWTKSIAAINFLFILGGCSTNPVITTVPYQSPSTGGVDVDFVTDVVSVSGPGILEIYVVRNPGCKDTSVLQKITELKSGTSFERLRYPEIKERRFSSRMEANVDLPLLFSYRYYDGTSSERCSVPIAFNLIESQKFEIRFFNDRKNGKCVVTTKSVDSMGHMSKELQPVPYSYDCK